MQRLYSNPTAHPSVHIYDPIKSFPVIWKEQVVLVVGAASSRDHLISRLEAAPTGGFLWQLGLSG